MKFTKPQLFAALFAAVSAAVAVLYPEYSHALAVLGGAVFGKEFLPQSSK